MLLAASVSEYPGSMSREYNFKWLVEAGTLTPTVTRSCSVAVTDEELAETGNTVVLSKCIELDVPLVVLREIAEVLDELVPNDTEPSLEPKELEVVENVTGWKLWLSIPGTPWLQSVYHIEYEWNPGVNLAKDGTFGGFLNHLPKEDPFFGGYPPGIYSWKERPSLPGGISTDAYWVVGRVQHLGETSRCEHGYRSVAARIISIDEVSEVFDLVADFRGLSVSVADPDQVLQELRDYYGV